MDNFRTTLRCRTPRGECHHYAFLVVPARRNISFLLSFLRRAAGPRFFANPYFERPATRWQTSVKPS